MSKAAAELPDTLDPADGPEKAVNVDDLLAQMAGDEIDRLLSEAETPTEKSAPVAEPSQTGVGEDAVAKQLDELFSGADTAAEPAVTPEKAVDPVAPALEHPTEPSSPVAPAGEPVGATAASLTGETAAAERAALDASFREALASDDGELADHRDDGALPFYLKPLAWLNAPLDSLSDPLRDLLGKLGLVTLFNASAVLIYVFLFRRRH